MSDWLNSPVLLGGMPKSGTTLLNALLDYHPNLVVAPEETTFFNYCFTQLERPLPNFRAKLSRKYLRKSALRMSYWGRLSDYKYLSPTTGEVEKFPYEAFIEDYFSQPKQAEGHLDALAAIYSSLQKFTGIPKPLAWVEKSIGNEFEFARIRKELPQHKFIYMIRDPRDNFVSLHKHRDRKNVDELKIDEQDFVERYTNSISKLLEMSQHSNVLVISYEKLVTELDVQLKRICEFIGIEHNGSLLIPTKMGVAWQGNSMHGRQFNGVSDKSMGIYRDKLSDDQVARLTDSLMDGYEKWADN